MRQTIHRHESIGSRFAFDILYTNVIGEMALGPETIPWLRRSILGNQLWQYVAFFGYVIAAVLLSKLADVLVRRGFKPSGRNDATALAEQLFTVLRGPLKLAVFILLLHLGVKPMKKPDWVQAYLDHGFGILIAVVVTYALMRIVDFCFAGAREKLQQRDRHGQHPTLLLLERAARIFLIGIAIVVTADNNGIKVGGVLASLGLTGLAVALAAQRTLSNLLGSIVILADSPFFLGDRVKIDAAPVVGYVVTTLTWFGGRRSFQTRPPGSSRLRQRSDAHARLAFSARCPNIPAVAHLSDLCRQGRHRPEHDFQIQPQGLLSIVLQVEVNHLIERGQILSRNLPQAGKAR